MMKTLVRIETAADYGTITFDDLPKGTRYTLESLLAGRPDQTIPVAAITNNQVAVPPTPRAQRFATPKQVALINNLMREAGINFPERFLGKYRVNKAEELSDSQIDHIIKTLKTIRAQKIAETTSTGAVTTQITEPLVTAEQIKQLEQEQLETPPQVIEVEEEWPGI